MGTADAAGGHREPRLDALKAIAIIMVVFGHALSIQVGGPAELTPLGIAIWTVHMPLFAFVSGLVTRTVDAHPLRFLVRRARQLMVPYALWTLIGAIAAGGGLTVVLRALARAALFPRTSLWFLYVLFVCCVLLAVSAPRGRRYVVVVGLLLLPAQVLPLPAGFLGVYDVMLLFPFFAAGYYLAQRAPSMQQAQVLPAVACALLYGVLLWLRASPTSPLEPVWSIALAGATDAANLRGARAIFVGASYLLGVTGVGFLFLISPAIKGCVQSMLALVGRNTLGVYAMQNWALSQIASRAGIHNAVLLTALAVAGTVGISVTLSRIPYARELLLGRVGASARRS